MNEPAGPVERLQRYRDLRARVAELLDSERARLALAVHDMATVYQILSDAGLSQRQIAEMAGQKQAEVCRVLAGRQVQSYAVLRRICDGLRVPRGRMGLAYDDETDDLLGRTNV